jgi:hypothetical protein
VHLYSGGTQAIREQAPNIHVVVNHDDDVTMP